MRAGRVVQVGTPKETYFQPLDLELAQFLGEAVVVGGDARPANHIGCAEAMACMATGAAVCSGSASVSCVFGTLPISSWHGRPGLCDVLIRPENIRVMPVGAVGADQPGLVGTILDHTFYGHDGVLRVQVPDLADQVSVRVLGDHEYDVGGQVRLVVDRPVSTYSS